MLVEENWFNSTMVKWVQKEVWNLFFFSHGLMDWLKGKPVGNHCFSPSNVWFPVNFPLMTCLRCVLGGSGWYSSDIVSFVQGVVGWGCISCTISFIPACDPVLQFRGAPTYYIHYRPWVNDSHSWGELGQFTNRHHAFQSIVGQRK